MSKNRIIILNAVNCSHHDAIPIMMIEGNSPPYIVGESWHYETKGGNRIYHPSAYRQRGWSNMVYCESTREIEVGEDWQQ